MSKFKFNISKPNFIDTKGWAALHYAAANKNYALATKLILAGADFDLVTKDKDGFSPLVLAINSHDLKMVNLLLQYGANPNLAIVNGNTPFMISIQRPQLAFEMSQSLVRAGANVSFFAEKSKLEPNKTKMEIVCQCLKINNVELIKNFIELVETAQLSKIDAIISTSELIAALEMGDDEKVMKFFKDTRISEAEKYKVNLFANAGLSKNMNLMLELIKVGYDLNKLDSNGAAPIHYAMYDDTGNCIMLMLLLYNGAVVDIRNEEGKTASEIAIEKGMYNLLNLLMEQGAKANILTSNGIPLLQMVIQSGLNMAKMFEVLIKYYADIEWCNEELMNMFAGDIIDPASIKLMQAVHLADSIFHMNKEFIVDEFIEAKQQASADFINIFGTRLNSLIMLAENYYGSLDPQLVQDIAHAKQLIVNINWQPNDILDSELRITKTVPWANLINIDSNKISNIIIEYNILRAINQFLKEYQQLNEEGDHLDNNTYNESPLAGEQTEYPDDL